jgi:5-(carboxyamino)imidazole ribonucleotide mutase
MPDVAVIMGSDSDMPKLSSCFEMLEMFNIPFEVVISSAHRTPEETKQWAKSAKDRGIKAIIAAAGGAAHLPGVIAAYTTLPVIGVPIETPLLGGLDSVLSILQMPSGIPVATMPVGKSGGANAALFIVSMLALSDQTLAKELEQYRSAQSQKVIEKNKMLQKEGYKNYINTIGGAK